MSGVRDCCLFHSFQTGYGAHKPSYATDNGDLSPVVKLTTQLSLVPMSPIRLYGIVLNCLSRSETLPLIFICVGAIFRDETWPISKSKKKSHYDRQSAGQSVLVFLVVYFPLTYPPLTYTQFSSPLFVLHAPPN
jgi:hypothetical protein